MKAGRVREGMKVVILATVVEEEALVCGIPRG